MFLLVIFSIFICVSDGANPPHIIFIVADDLGWNDVSWHNPDILTPNLERLGREGVFLEQSYVQYLCTPSRSAFLTGRYPIHTGMQTYVLLPMEPEGLPLNTTIMPELLKTVGYKTHMVGKWHLGFCDWRYTPTYRGFDSFFGYYNGKEDHFSHNVSYSSLEQEFTGLDLHRNEEPDWTESGKYSTYIFAEEAVSIISQHNASEPLYLYMPFQAVHEPLEVPQEYEDLYPSISDENRRIYSGMVTAMDEAVGNITDALIQYGLYENSIIVWTTDNGGNVTVGGNNWPLRGGKGTLYEGGTRGPALVHSPLLETKGYINEGMIHTTDWFPTLLRLAGVDAELIGSDLDGMDQWDTISLNMTSPRTEFVYNIDYTVPYLAGGAIRVGDYKLIKGYGGVESSWYPVPDSIDALSDAMKLHRNHTVQLYNVQTDPLEQHDLSKELPDVVEEMTARFAEYRKSMVPARVTLSTWAGAPKHFGDVWSPGWCTAT